GHSLMLAAGDTFRAAAVAQLQAWGERNGVAVVDRPQCQALRSAHRRRQRRRQDHHHRQAGQALQG
ncbi:hypothetical protein C7E25_14235, partial [Stenotrophomonas maltophilia]